MATSQVTRRRFMSGLAGAGVVGARPVFASDRETFPVAVGVLRQARDREMMLYYRYVEYARHARLEGYNGIAYLFTAFAAAEFLHAQNFNKILTRLGVEIEPASKPDVQVGRTKANLLTAAALEREDVDSFYPALLGRLKQEQVDDAVTFVTYAWLSEKQHRAIVGKILKWAPSFFETVAKQIDKESGQYFVCQSCGSTVNQVPADRCVVCNQPVASYRKIEAPV